MAKHHGARSSKASPSLGAILAEIRESRSKKDLQKASRLVGQAEKLFPGSAEVLVETGYLHLSTNRLAEADASFRQALSLNPNLIEASSGLIKVLMATGKLRQAEDLARDLSNQFPDDLTIGQLLSQILIDQSRLPEAIEVLQKVVTTHPGSVTTLNSLAKRLSEVGDFEQSQRVFEQAIDLDPTNAFAYLGWVQSRRVNEADRGMVQAMEVNASSPKLHEQARTQILFALGKALDDLGDYEKAMETFHKANLLRDSISTKKQPFQPELYEQLFGLTRQIFTSEAIQRLQTKASSKPTPIFIVGMFRSGTTLVEQILSSHSHVSAGGEIQYWLDVSAACFDHNKRSFDFPRAVAMRRPYQDRLQSLGSTSEFVTDKMPGNYRALGLLRILFPNAKFVHCVRNPIDTCLSIYMTAFNQPPNYASDPKKLVMTYRLYEQFMQHWKSNLEANSIHEVRYETLVQQPEETTRALLNFCELDFETACLRPEENLRSVSTASIWQARQPIYQSATEKWRRYEPWLGALNQLQEP